MGGFVKFLLASALISMLLTLARAKWKSHWSARRVTLNASLMVPIAVAFACLYIFVQTANTPQDHCAVDACAMTMMALMIVGPIAFGTSAVAGMFSSGISLSLLPK